MDRKQVGQERLGAPIIATFDALVEAVDRKAWGDFQREPVGYYFSKMIGGWLLRLMDSALSDEQLQAVEPHAVVAIMLLLFRDMFRQNARLLRPATASASWVEELFSEVAGDLKLPPAHISDDGKLYELDDMSNCGWAKQLSAPFGLPAEKLFVCHSAIVTGAREELGGDG
jgi:hypothetical protein